MSRWSGKIGYSFNEENPSGSGIYVDRIVERQYYGDLISDTRRLRSSNQVNDDIIISNQISFVADPFAVSNFQNIKFATFMGSRWKVESIEVSLPRLILNLGDVYNGLGGPSHE